MRPDRRSLPVTEAWRIERRGQRPFPGGLLHKMDVYWPPAVIGVRRLNRCIPPTCNIKTEGPLDADGPDAAYWSSSKCRFPPPGLKSRSCEKTYSSDPLAETRSEAPSARTPSQPDPPASAMAWPGATAPLYPAAIVLQAHGSTWAHRQGEDHGVASKRVVCGRNARRGRGWRDDRRS
jgi:hypothetical protein